MTEMFPYPPSHLSVRKRALVTAANESREPEPEPFFLMYKPYAK